MLSVNWKNSRMVIWTWSFGVFYFNFFLIFLLSLFISFISSTLKKAKLSFLLSDSIKSKICQKKCHHDDVLQLNFIGIWVFSSYGRPIPLAFSMSLAPMLFVNDSFNFVLVLSSVLPSETIKRKICQKKCYDVYNCILLMFELLVLMVGHPVIIPDVLIYPSYNENF